jgi:alkanesulfonate monooxygenase SsuD/methylene tetrahydromethanopterin reductase-like flavin-dependent oxidoreductase (luciferase family)
LTAGRRYLNLNAYLRNSGYHDAAWRVSPADPASVLDPRYSIDLARTAERGVLDSIFLPDSPGVAGWKIVTTAEPAAAGNFAFPARTAGRRAQGELWRLHLHHGRRRTPAPRSAPSPSGCPPCPAAWTSPGRRRAWPS